MSPRRIVLTGGPGAGKTAVLEIVRRVMATSVAIVPESASLLFRGGFPRETSDVARCAAQRAIFHVQTELETVIAAIPGLVAMLCDRGTVDGVAYWPHAPDEFWRDVGTTAAAELARYDAVIHLEPPSRQDGYHRDTVRTETAREAAMIDVRIAEAWRAHPKRYVVPSTPRFLDKVERVMSILTSEIPVVADVSGESLE